MAIKISELTALSTAASADVLPLVDDDVSATKKITIENLLRSLPDGTEAAPGLAFGGDQDTGLYQPAANVLAAVTGGVERWRTNSNGGLVVGGTTSDGLLTTFGLSTDQGHRYRGSRIELDDDDVYSVSPTQPVNVMVINKANDGAIISVNAFAGNTSVIAQTGSTYTGQSGALTGTTGPDGNVNVSADSSGTLYIENRTGVTLFPAFSLLASR
jgi:hypothetical protein